MVSPQKSGITKRTDWVHIELVLVSAIIRVGVELTASWTEAHQARRSCASSLETLTQSFLHRGSERGFRSWLRDIGEPRSCLRLIYTKKANVNKLAKLLPTKRDSSLSVDLHKSMRICPPAPVNTTFIVRKHTHANCEMIKELLAAH